ncbi:MAG TPA: methyltransferase domain-containing protein [Ktedonobacteraceae bacterium]
MYRNLTARDFSRQDDADDANFYAMPRMVIHLDDKAVSLVKDIARRYMPPMHVRVLDLMSSFRSHLPEDRPYTEVIGLGMNMAEMQANPQLNRQLVHDLNKYPQLPFNTGYFDVVINTVSIQYLTQPVAVYREVARVLRPAGVSIVIFSDRMFPTKAVRVWVDGDDDDHIALVQEYHRLAGGFRNAQTERYPGGNSSWFRSAQDPLYAVVGTRDASAPITTGGRTPITGPRSPITGPRNPITGPRW